MRLRLAIHPSMPSISVTARLAPAALAPTAGDTCSPIAPTTSATSTARAVVT